MLMVVVRVGLERLGRGSYQKTVGHSLIDQVAQGRSNGYVPLKLLLLMVVDSFFGVEKVVGP